MVVKLKTRLYCSAAVVMFACVGSAQAQEQTLETIVVTGQRAALQSAIALKQKADEIVDIVSAEDVGKLPDNSVTEVLQRIAGINMTRIQVGSGSEDYLGEGTGITIRGLTQNVSQLNGHDAFSSSGGRNLSWEDIPPELMQGVDVYKSLSAWMPEAGFGGVVNLRTRKPFDYEGFSFSSTLTANYADYAAAARFGGSALISDRWNTKIGEIGVLLNVAYSDLLTKADGVQVSPFLPAVWSANYPTAQGLPWVSSYNLNSDSLTPTTCSGATGYTCQEVYVPSAINYTQRNDERVRQGLYLAVQWNVSERLQLYATAFQSRYNNNTLNYSIQSGSGTVALDPSSTSTFDANGNLISSNGIRRFGWTSTAAANQFGLSGGTTYNAIPYAVASNLQHTTNQTSDFTVGGEWNPNDVMTVTFAAQHVESMSRNNGKWGELYTFVPNYGVTLSAYGNETIPYTTFPAIDSTQKYSYGWNSTMQHLTSDAGQENAIYADGIWNVSSSAFLRTVKFGVKITNRVENDNETSYNWAALTPSYTSGAIKTAGSTDAKYTTLVDTGNWFNGETGLPAQMWFPSLTMLKTNYDTIHSYTDGLGAQNDPKGELHLTPYDHSSVKENYASIYAQAHFAYDDWLIPFSGTIGLRGIAFKYKGDGYFSPPYFNSSYMMEHSNFTCAETATVHCVTTGYTGSTLAYTVAQTYTPGSGSHSEMDVLPSLNLQFNPLDQLKVRFAASQGVSRPTLAQLSPRGNANADNSGTFTYLAYYSGNVGNPNLKPEKADQLDASIEYYFKGRGLVHISPFYKQIHNYIANASEIVNMTVAANVAGGSYTSTDTTNLVGCPTTITLGATCTKTVSVTMTKPINEQGTATIKGFEAGLTKYADFLPDPFDGFGVDLNYTYIESSQPGALAYDVKGKLISGLPAVGLSKNSFNAAVLYDKQPISIKVAYNWRDDFLVSTSAYQTAGQYNYALNQSSVNGVTDGKLVHFSLPVYQYPMGTLDASMTLQLTDNLSWSMQASNLTKAVARLYMGEGNRRENRSWYTADTRYSAQLRMKF